MNNITNIAKLTKKYNLLYVEDDEKTQGEFKDLLEIFFTKVYVASNGKEALEFYQNCASDIDIIITDLNMPKLSGFDLIKQVKEINPLQYVIVISAFQDIQTYQKLLQLNVNDFVVKPIITEKFVQILHKVSKSLEYIHKLTAGQYCEKESCIKINGQLYIDELTQLNNKNKLDQYLDNNNFYNIILINIDNFDAINCNYGYKIADIALQQIASLLNSIKPDYCKLFRVVADEFAYICDDVDSNIIKELVQSIIQAFNDFTIDVEVNQFNISCTIGISSGKSKDILRKAHIAIREAREIGKEKYCFFASNLLIEEKHKNNIQWLKKVKNVIKDDLVIPYYQPIIDNKTNKIDHHETLIRVMELNRISKPHYYLENAKLFNLLPNITKMMVDKVFKNIANTHTKISLNIADDDMLDNSIIEYIINKANKNGINPSNIIFDINESILLNKKDKVFQNLMQLHSNGFRIAIDDFGVNHFNIEKLHNIKIDYIKIAPIIVENILNDKKSKHIINSIIKYAQAIDAKVIAKSVSTKDIYNQIKELNIDYSQGYFIGKPSELLKTSK